LWEDGEDLAEIGGAVGDEFEDETAVGVVGDIARRGAEEELLAADGDAAAELGVGVGGVIGEEDFVGEFADLLEGGEVFEEVAGAGVGATGGVVERGADEEVMGADGDGGAEGVACGAVGGGEACELGAGGDGVDVDGTARAFFIGGAGEEQVAMEGDGGAKAGGGAGDFGEESAGGGAVEVNALGCRTSYDAGHGSADGEGVTEEGDGFSELKEEDVAVSGRRFDGADVGAGGGVEDVDDAPLGEGGGSDESGEGGVAGDDERAIGCDGGAEAGVHDWGGFGAEEAFRAGQGLGAKRTC